MADGRLVIGNRRYSSWSLRGWLPVQIAGLDVEEVMIPLGGEGNTAAIKGVTPTGLVPYLEHKGAKIWESLAIAEYCAEIFPALWPGDRVARAAARSIASEVHAGFRELRMAMPMNLGRVFPGKGRTPGALADIKRVEALWAEALGAHKGEFLFGDTLTVPDIMFAPIVTRFLTWQPELAARSHAYCKAVRAHRLVDSWYRGAAAEPEAWLLPKYESVA